MTRRGSKYGNRRVEVDGYVLDSKAEARRYGELRLLEQAGEIVGLDIHPVYELAPRQQRGGRTLRRVTYEADFSYRDWRDGRQGDRVVEDVKGVRTKTYALKRRLFLARYPGLLFVEVDARTGEERRWEP